MIKNLRKRVNEKLSEYNAVRMRYKKERADLIEAEEALNDIQEAQIIAQTVAKTVQQKVHNQIASVVSRCLEIFDEPYEFKIVFEQKRGRTEARLLFERDGLEVDPMTASGGGVVDVASFALRLSCLMLSKPSLRKILILDEPFKFVSEEYRDRIRILLETLSEDLGIQILMVTHIKELEIGKIIKLKGD